MYFSYRLKREVVELYWNTGLYNFATNLTYIFEPIFLYNLGASFIQIMFFYLLVYLAYALLVMPITKITCHIGYKHAIFISTIVYVGYWLALYNIKFLPNLFYIAPILFAVQKSFFWPPYNADIAHSNIKRQRGREVGVLFSIVEIVAILGPVIGGFISYQFGFPILFLAASLIMLFSVYPLFQSPEIFAKHNFRFKNFWDILVKYPHNFFGYFGYAEDLMLMTLWPLFIYLVIPEVFSVGLIITVASFVAIMIMLYLGRLLDRYPKFNFLPVAALFYGLTWLFRTGVGSLFGVAIVDSLTRLGKAMVNVPLLSLTFELAGQKDQDYAIAYAVFFEFSLAIGKILTAVLAIWILTATGSVSAVFLAVGILTMLYALLRKK